MTGYDESDKLKKLSTWPYLRLKIKFQLNHPIKPTWGIRLD